MNFALAKEIYGNPWFVDAASINGLLGIQKALSRGVMLEVPEIKYNTPCILEVNSETRIISRPYGNEWVPGQLDNNDKFDGIGLININGAITLSGGNSTVGMEQLSQLMYQMASDDRIKGFIILTNSGGGASGAVDTMKDAIREIDKTKPVYGVIKKGGMAASAAYGILTPTRKIYSEHKMNVVGSAGTMIEFDGRAANTVAEDGTKHIRIYASKSTMKNKAFEEALNNDNYELIINELLDPINENFLNGMLEDRPQLLGSNYDNGHTVFSKDAIGTFIDGIASFNEVVNLLIDEINFKPSFSSSQNSVKMNRNELKSTHPELFSEVHSEGVTAERERVASWMAYQEADAKAVAEGISSGKDISPSQREGLMIKMMSFNQLQALQGDNAPALQTGAAPVVVGKEKETSAEAVAAFDFNLK